MQYYSIPSSGLCAIKDENMPSWIADDSIFDNYADCCKKGWVEAKCLAEAPPGAIEDVAGSKLQYYVVPATGICSPVDVYAPSYVSTADFFSSYEDCCKKSWDETSCMAAKPEISPTLSPSLRPTDAPSLSTGPSFSPSISTTASPSDAPSSSTGPSVSPSTTVSPDSNSTETFNETSATEPTAFSSETNSTKDDLNMTETDATTSTTTTATTTTTSNSSCVAALWHVSEYFDKCTNA